MLRWFEVRVRVRLGPDKWVKKSKFYKAQDSRSAAGKYQGPGTVIFVRKVDREDVLGFKNFLGLGDKLLGSLGKDGERRHDGTTGAGKGEETSSKSSGPEGQTLRG